MDPRASTVALGAAVFLSCVASVGVVARLRHRLRLLVVASVLGMGLAQLVLALCFLHAEQREAAIRLRLAEEGEGADRTEIELADPLPEHVRWLPVCAALAFIVVGEHLSLA